MTQIVDDLVSAVLPTSVKYVAEQIKDDITDLRLGRKVHRNLFRLISSGSAVVFSALLPTVIAPDSVGSYLNEIFNALLHTENTAVLYLLSSTFCISTIGSASLFGSKQLYRLLNKHWYGHTNSDYNFDDKRIEEITKRYAEQYQDINPQLIQKKVKADIEFILTMIKEKRDQEEELSKTIKEYKKNPKKMEIISPKDTLSKADWKLILALYIHGDNRAFKEHLSFYSKEQSLYIKHYTKPALEMCELANHIESRYPSIIPKDSMHRNAEYLHRVGRRENIVPSLPPLHPLLNIFEAKDLEAAHDLQNEQDDGPYLEEVVVNSDSDDEKYEMQPATNPLTFLEPYLRQQTLEKRRASFRPTIQPTIDEEFAKELHHDIDKVLIKMKNAVEEASHKKNRAEKRKRKTI